MSGADIDADIARLERQVSDLQDERGGLEHQVAVLTRAVDQLTKVFWGHHNANQVHVEGARTALRVIKEDDEYVDMICTMTKFPPEPQPAQFVAD